MRLFSFYIKYIIKDEKGVFMKIFNYVQMGLLVIIATILLVMDPFHSEKAWAAKHGGGGHHKGHHHAAHHHRGHHKGHHGRYWGYYGHHRYYYPYFYSPLYLYPYSYSYSHLYITVRQGPDQERSVVSLRVDGKTIRLRLPNRNGSRGNYSMRVSKGYHLIQWKVQRPNGRVRTYSREIYVDSYGRSIVIDGDQFYLR